MRLERAKAVANEQGYLKGFVLICGPGFTSQLQHLAGPSLHSPSVTLNLSMGVCNVGMA